MRRFYTQVKALASNLYVVAGFVVVWGFMIYKGIDIFTEPAPTAYSKASDYCSEVAFRALATGAHDEWFTATLKRLDALPPDTPEIVREGAMDKLMRLHDKQYRSEWLRCMDEKGYGGKVLWEKGQNLLHEPKPSTP